LLSQIAVGNDDDVWGIGTYGGIYEFDFAAGKFQLVPGPALAQIAVGGSKGLKGVWGLTSGGDIYRLNPNTGQFEKVLGWLTKISVRSPYDAWGVNGYGQIFLYTGDPSNPWSRIPGPPLAQIVAGGDYSGTWQVWGLDSNGQIYQFSSLNENWYQIPGALAQIAIGSSGDVGEPGIWGVNRSAQIYQFERPDLKAVATRNQSGYDVEYSGSEFQPGVGVDLYLVSLGGGPKMLVGHSQPDPAGNVSQGTYSFGCGSN
jgi:hypothetical protein